MTSGWKKNLLDFLAIEIDKARVSAQKTDEASNFIMTGDKYHAQKAAELTDQYLKRLEKLRDEIITSGDEIKTKAEPVSCVDIEYKDGARLKFILVNTAVSLTRYLFISIDSPLGKAVLNKKDGDVFSYSLNLGNKESNFSGKVLRIE